MRRAAIALLLFPALVLGILAFCSQAFAESTQIVAFNASSGMGPFGVLFAWALLCAIAVPALLAALLLRRLRLSVAVSVGAIAGYFSVGLPALQQVFDPRLHLQYGLEHVLGNYPFVLIGIVAGVVFWALAAWRNPAVATHGRVSLALPFNVA